MSDEETEQIVKVDTQDVVSDFWVSTYPFFEGKVFILPSGGVYGELVSTHLAVRDPDGVLINSVRLDIPVGKISSFNLDMFLGACKIESGMRHALLHLVSPAGSKHLCQITDKQKSRILCELRRFSTQESAFVPLMCTNKIFNLLPVANFSDKEADVQIRLFGGNEENEQTLTIPAGGVKIFSPDTRFQQIAHLEDGGFFTAYLRLTAQEGSFGVQQISCVMMNDFSEYITIC